MNGNREQAASLLRESAELHAPAVLASSLGAEDMVLLDMIDRQRLPIGVFTLDTGRLHQETYDLLQRARERYGVPITTPVSVIRSNSVSAVMTIAPATAPVRLLMPPIDFLRGQT